jgi:hypothetical protein
MSAVKLPTAKEAKVKAAKRTALTAMLTGRREASSTSLATSYGLPLSEVQSAMRSMGVNDNG